MSEWVVRFRSKQTLVGRSWMIVVEAKQMKFCEMYIRPCIPSKQIPSIYINTHNLTNGDKYPRRNADDALLVATCVVCEHRRIFIFIIIIIIRMNKKKKKKKKNNECCVRSTRTSVSARLKI